MKKAFNEPEVTVIRLEENDVIVTSGCGTIPGQTIMQEFGQP